MKINLRNMILLAITVTIASISYRLFFSPSAQKISGKKIIIIGASSGIGKALAQICSAHDNQVGLTGRRTELLEDLAKKLPTKSYVKHLDVSKSEAPELLEQLIQEMGGLDLIVINSGAGFQESNLDWSEQKQTIETNVLGFAAMANVALKQFITQGHGHIVGISSIMGLRGSGRAFTYCATKAFDSMLLEGIRNFVASKRLPIFVTDIQPGGVATDMLKSEKELIWVASPQEAAQAIFNAIEARREHAYVTKRWCLFAWLLKYAPDWLLNRVL